MTTDTGTQADRVDALVIFGATGDLAKLETFPALVGLVDRGVLDVPVIGVAKSGWGLEQFRDYAGELAQAQQDGPQKPCRREDAGLAALRRRRSGRSGALIRLCRTPSARAAACCSTWKCRRHCSDGSLRAYRRQAEPVMPASWSRSHSVTDLKSSEELNQTMHKFYPEDAIYRVDDWLGFDPVENCAVRPVREL